MCIQTWRGQLTGSGECIVAGRGWDESTETYVLLYSVFNFSGTPSICALLDLKRYSSAHIIICVCTNVQYVLCDILKDLSFVDTFLDEILVREGEI